MEPTMKRASVQLLEETNYPNLAAFLRSGGKLEVGEDLSVGTFARTRKGNQTVTVDAAYRDFKAVLKEMEAKARDFLNGAYERRSPESK
jgi:hypothetical protein